MAKNAQLPLFFCPPPIAIHNDGKVAWQIIICQVINSVH
jgi:hypothetical protein